MEAMKLRLNHLFLYIDLIKKIDVAICLRDDLAVCVLSKAIAGFSSSSKFADKIIFLYQTGDFETCNQRLQKKVEASAKELISICNEVVGDIDFFSDEIVTPFIGCVLSLSFYLDGESQAHICDAMADMFFALGDRATELGNKLFDGLGDEVVADYMNASIIFLTQKGVDQKEIIEFVNRYGFEISNGLELSEE